MCQPLVCSSLFWIAPRSERCCDTSLIACFANAFSAAKSAENTTSAEAQIRDTDIATEMVRYANNNILQQAGTSMLSQANQSNQLALSLLG